MFYGIVEPLFDGRDLHIPTDGIRVLSYDDDFLRSEAIVSKTFTLLLFKRCWVRRRLSSARVCLSYGRVIIGLGPGLVGRVAGRVREGYRIVVHVRVAI